MSQQEARESLGALLVGGVSSPLQQDDPTMGNRGRQAAPPLVNIVV